MSQSKIVALLTLLSLLGFALSIWGLTEDSSSQQSYTNLSTTIVNVSIKNIVFTGVLENQLCSAANVLYRYKIGYQQNTYQEKELCSPEEKYWCCNTMGCSEILVSSPGNSWLCYPFAAMNNQTQNNSVVFRLGDSQFAWVNLHEFYAYLIAPPEKTVVHSGITLYLTLCLVISFSILFSLHCTTVRQFTTNES